MTDARHAAAVAQARRGDTKAIEKLLADAEARADREHKLRCECEARFDHRIASGVKAVAAANELEQELRSGAEQRHGDAKTIVDLIVWAQTVDGNRKEAWSVAAHLALCLRDTHGAVYSNFDEGAVREALARYDASVRS